MTTFKKFLTLLLAICMIVSVLSLTACGGDDENDNNTDNTNTDNTNTDNTNGDNTATDKTYTVTVLDGDNNPVAGVKLVITDEKTYPNVTTDATGKASVQLPADTTTVKVMVTSVPDGYVKPEKVSGVYHGVFASGATEFTLKVEKEASNKSTYTVKVVDQNGDAVVGINVQLCYNGICAAAVPTDENGEITAQLAAGTAVDVKLYDINGYILPTANANGYHASSSETDIEIVITKK